MASPIQRRLARYRMRNASARAVASAIAGSLELMPLAQRRRMTTIARRIESCAISQRVRVETPVDDATQIRAFNKRACKIRLCPQCLYVTACRDRKRLTDALERIFTVQPDIRAILLTLTTRNRPLISGLKEMLHDHQFALNRFWRSKRIVAASCGSFSAIELEIRGTPDKPEAGIHSHSIMLVPPTYFANDLPAIWHAEFRDLWQRAARLDYAPIVDCRVARAADGSDDRDATFGSVVECAKYCVSLESLFTHHGSGHIACDGVIAATILDAFRNKRLHRVDRLFAEAMTRGRRSPCPA
jgi:plasmid rolling circle replication initiator protein Rep